VVYLPNSHLLLGGVLSIASSHNSTGGTLFKDEEQGDNSTIYLEGQQKQQGTEPTKVIIECAKKHNIIVNVRSGKHEEYTKQAKKEFSDPFGEQATCFRITCRQSPKTKLQELVQDIKNKLSFMEKLIFQETNGKVNISRIKESNVCNFAYPIWAETESSTIKLLASFVPPPEEISKVCGKSSINCPEKRTTTSTATTSTTPTTLPTPAPGTTSTASGYPTTLAAAAAVAATTLLVFFRDRQNI
jgi:hypothetical protein